MRPDNNINSSFRIPDSVEARLIELSLQYPEFGATRLSRLLKQEIDDVSISPSSVYNILRRHGLQNREKRFARIKVKQAVEELRSPSENPPPVPRVRADKILLPHDKPVAVKIRSSWGLTAFNILLIILIVFSGLITTQNIRSAISEPQPVPVVTQAPTENIPASIKPAVLPLDNYNPIWERNLFNISQKEAPAQIKESAAEELSLAKQDLGLELVGTVVSDDPSLNRALIENLAVRSQGIYRVENRIEHVLIKEILRDRIIIDAGRGDEVLILSNPSITVTQKQDIIQTADLMANQQVDAAQPVSTVKKSSARHRTISLSREAVESALSNIDQSLDNVHISSGKVFNRQTGFRIASFEKDTIFSQLGLRNNDLVLSINNQRISNPEEAKAFFEKIREGGSLEVRVRRRARTITLHMSIE